MANLITWTALPGGRHDESAARTRLSLFVSLRIEDPPACPEVDDWPATLAGLRFQASVEGGSPADFSEDAGTLVRGTAVRPSSEAWRLGLGHTTARPAALSAARARATAARFADEGRTLSFDSQGIATALRTLYGEAVRRQAEGVRSGKQPAGTVGSFDSRNVALRTLASFTSQETIPAFEEFYRPVEDVPPLQHDTSPFDFSQTLALVGQHPHLMRLLGLVVDFEIDLPPRSLPAQGKVRIAPATPPGCPTSSLWTAFESATRSGHVLFTARARDASQYRNGFLHLGTGSRYGVIQEDIEGQTFKVRSMGRHLSLGRDEPDAEASNDLPAQRTVGLTFLHTGRAGQLADDSRQALTALASAEAAGATHGVAAETVFLEDVCRPVRPDVRLDEREFRSLCSRQVDYRIGEGEGAVEIPGVDEEGSVTGAAVQPDAQVRVHEALFRFDGFGLAVDRPFQAVDAGAGPSHDTKDLRVGAVPRAAKGSLHPLRYGGRYRFAVRTVDVAGGGLTLEDTRRLLGSEPPAIAEAVSEPVRFVRREPIGSPLVVPLRELPPGEADNLIAVRTDRQGHSQGSARHLLPPQVAVEVVERSGVLDGLTAAAAFRLLDERDQELDQEHYSRKHFSEVPYLADPLARHARLEFLGLPDQAGPVVLVVPFQENGWPKANGILLELAPGYDPPRVERESVLGLCDRPRVRVELPPGWRAAVLVQSIPDPADLPTTFLAQYGLDGDAALVAHPALAPARRIELLHAVERPLAVPAFTDVQPRPRAAADTFVVLDDRLAVEVSSTGRLTCLASWDEPVDAPVPPPGGEPRPPGSERRGGEAFSFPVDPALEHVLLAEGGRDHLGQGIVNRHHLGTTGHRRIEYRLLAETRFPEFFPDSRAEDKRLESPPAVVDVPNAARPPALSVRHVVPVFDWLAEDEALGRKSHWPKRRSRRVVRRDRLGRRLRIYVERPALLSGFQEQLGVVLWPAPLADVAPEEAQCLRQVVTQWALDPIWESAALPDGPFARHFPLAETTLEGIQLVEIPELSQEPAPGTERECSVAEGRLANRVVVAGHALHFDAETDAWYADVEVDSAEAYFPFVRLALVRFQPISQPGAHASRLIFADFAQLAPDRYLTLTYVKTPRPAVEISLVGPGYEPQAGDRPEAHIEVWLEHPAVRHTDLGWEQEGDEVILSRTSLPDGRMAWGGTLPLPEPCRHGTRLTVREFERFRQSATGAVRQRLVYADTVSVRP